MQVSSTGGDSSCSWVAVHALGHNLGRDAGDPSTPHTGECRVKGITPDFILEYFIVLYFNDTAGTPHKWELEFIGRTIQHNSAKVDIG